jgi:hypothetical protein
MEKSVKLAKYHSNILTLNGITIEARTKDNFINATQLCKAGSKKFAEWHELFTTKEVIDELAQTQEESEEIILIDKKASGAHSGIWIHPDLTIHLAQWISPSFVIPVSKWIRELFIKTSIFSDSNKYMVELQHQLEKKDEQIADMKSQVATLTNYIHNEETLVKDGYVFIATSGDHSFQNQYRLGKCEIPDLQAQDNSYYLFLHNCAYPNLLEIIIHKLLKKYRHDSLKSIYIVKWPILEKFMKEICKNYDNMVATTNSLIAENLNSRPSVTPPKSFNFRSFSNAALKMIMPAPKPKFQPHMDLDEIKQRIMDNWSDNGYFLNMYDMMVLCDMPHKSDKEGRRLFKAKLETRSLVAANNKQDLGKDYCMTKQQVGGSIFYTDVPYLSVAGFNKYYNHKKTLKHERINLQKIVNIMKEIEDPSDTECGLTELVDEEVDDI